PDYGETILLWSLLVFIRSSVIWETVHDFQLGIKSYQQKVNLTASTISFLEIKKHEMFSIIYKPVHGIIYKNSKKEKRYGSSIGEVGERLNHLNVIGAGSADAPLLRRAIRVSNPNLVLSSYTTWVDVSATVHSNVTSLRELTQPAVSVMNPSNMFSENVFGLINVPLSDAILVSFGFDSTVLADRDGIRVTRLAGKLSLSSENIITQVHDDGAMDSAKAPLNVNKDDMSFSTSMEEPIVQAASISMKPSSYAGVTSSIHSEQVVNFDVLPTEGNDDAIVFNTVLNVLYIAKIFGVPFITFADIEDLINGLEMGKHTAVWLGMTDEMRKDVMDSMYTTLKRITDENPSVARNVGNMTMDTVNPLDPVTTMPEGSAGGSKPEPTKLKVNFRSLSLENLCKGAKLSIPRKVVEMVSTHFANTLYGYFIGKRIAFPMVE
nr:hypothetical protein [Tanacetum cinerariifolium]